jgi:hypothetical protein
LLKGFLEKVSPDRLQVVTEQIAEAEGLLLAEVFFLLEQQPTGLLQSEGRAQLP